LEWLDSSRETTPQIDAVEKIPELKNTEIPMLENTYL